MKRNELTAALGVNATAKCDCGGASFEIGVALSPNGNNFVRVIECTSCGLQMVVSHQANDGLVPTLKN